MSLHKVVHKAVKLLVAERDGVPVATTLSLKKGCSVSVKRVVAPSAPVSAPLSGGSSSAGEPSPAGQAPATS